MKNEIILLGIKRFTSKEGKAFAVLEVSTPFSDREQKLGCVGSRVEEIFLPDSLHGKSESLAVGSPLGIDYEVINGRAYVDDVYTLKK